jgi:hypothetical protein
MNDLDEALRLIRAHPDLASFVGVARRRLWRPTSARSSWRRSGWSSIGRMMAEDAVIATYRLSDDELGSEREWRVGPMPTPCSP